MQKLITILWVILVGEIACTSGQKQSPPEDSPSVMHHIDHIIVAINNLDSGIAQFERLTGIKPVAGGEHPGRGTHNALVSLGAQTYLEIIAPRTNLDSSEYALSQHLLSYSELTPVGWALNSSEIDNSRKMISDLELNVSDISAGSRIKPDGSRLSWNTFAVNDEISGLPFFIEWGEDSVHPSTTSPKGAELVKISISSPDSENLLKLLNASGIDAQISNGEPLMVIELTTPKGIVVLPKTN